VIVLDLLLPDLDGFAVCKQLKGNPQTRPIPVVLFTGSTRIADIMQGFEAGADMFIGKGLDYNRLVSYVNTVLAKRNGGEPNGYANLTMKTCQELVEWLCAAFESVVRPRMEIALGTNAAAAVLQQAAERMQAGWKIQALREGTYDHLAVREAVIEFNTYVTEVFRILEERANTIETSYLKDAFEQQLTVFD
jgi:DNA-binding response OmpR family regulator